MNNDKTPLERFLVSVWKPDEKSTIDALLGASGYACEIERYEDAQDMAFCASVALGIVYE